MLSNLLSIESNFLSKVSPSLLIPSLIVDLITAMIAVTVTMPGNTTVKIVAQVGISRLQLDFKPVKAPTT